MTSSKSLYRKDIDGIRAIAVLTVVFYHVGFSEFPGGFVGVDVFFVISGFLITSLIYQDLQNNSFSFTSFWIRRARRILPAASFMMLFVALSYALFYPTYYYADLGKSLIAQSLFSSNILFWKEGGYFATAQELKPLLHTWSLAVEEQFYFIFPALIWIIHRFFKRHTILLIGCGCLLSFFISVYAGTNHPIPGFYLLPARAWELGVGALLAVVTPRYNSSNEFLCNFLNVMGVVCIFIAVFTYSEDIPFPSYAALLPVLGTGAIIWANSKTDTFLGKLLCLKPLVWIGLLSYSLYLWHWPIIVLKNWIYPDKYQTIYSIVTIMVCFIFAFISFKIVEQPIRKNRIVYTDRRVILGSLFSTGILICIGFSSIVWGNHWIVDPDRSIENFYVDALKPEENRAECNDLLRRNSPKISCQYINRQSGKKIDMFVWGDSHAGAAIPAFKLAAEELNYNLEYSTTQGCQPVIGMKRVDWFQSCAEINNAILEYIKNNQFQTIILIGSFVHNVNKGSLRDVRSDDNFDSVKSIQEFGIRFRETVSILKATGARVLVFTEPPRFPINPVDEYVRIETLKLQIQLPRVARTDHITRIREIYGLIDSADIDERLDYINYFCNELICQFLSNGKSLYKDSGHMSVYAANQIAPLIGKDLATHIDQSR